MEWPRDARSAAVAGERSLELGAEKLTTAVGERGPAGDEDGAPIPQPPCGAAWVEAVEYVVPPAMRTMFQTHWWYGSRGGRNI